MIMAMEDEYYMKLALSLAAQGGTAVSPNPLVGCVIVKDGAIIGRGWHKYYGGAHAEVNAVKDAGGDVVGATVYVSLEPCSHYGKTPPCADMLAEKKVARVIIGMGDPNPEVNGKGIEKLRAAGIEVVSGVLEEACRRINAGFIFRMREGRPFVTLKVASSLDGRIALEDGSSKWITEPESRKRTHEIRALNDAVLTGIGTVLADDPQLTVRAVSGRTPLRVVLDRELRMPEGAKILDVSQGKVLIITGAGADRAKLERLRARAVDIEQLSCEPEHQIEAILALLCLNGVNYLMIEAGAGVVGSFLNARRVDKLSLFIAPKILGCGKSWTDLVSIKTMAEAMELKKTAILQVGTDILMEGVFTCSPDL